MLKKFYFLSLIVAFGRSSETSTEFIHEEKFDDGERSYKWWFSRKKSNETLEFRLKINLDGNNDDQVEKINITDMKNKIQEIIVKKEPTSEKILLLTLNQPLTVEIGDQDRELVTVNSSGDRDVAADIETDFGVIVKATTPKNPFDRSIDVLDAMLLALINTTFRKTTYWSKTIKKWGNKIHVKFNC
uniref:Uncharacterized protein n=1 Tax=Romanomermis culicivorax TaxID=13658 RepID=A0A915KVT6_ROMCU